MGEVRAPLDMLISALSHEAVAGEEDLETKLCHFCLKTGVLCPRCEEKVRSGEVSQSYIGVARLLLDLEDKGFTALQDATLMDVAEIGDVLVLVFKRGDLTRLGPTRGRLARALEGELGKRVHMVEGDVDERTFLEQLFAPATLVTINRIWLPDDSVEIKVILRGRRPWADVRTLAEVARELRNLSLRVEFER